MIVLVLIIGAGIGGIFYYKLSHREKKQISDGENSTIVKQNVKVIDGDSDLQPVEVNEDSIVFEKNPNYKKNDVIVAGIIDAAPDGFIRRVVKIEKKGKEYQIKTKQAMLTDVFEKAHIIKTIKLEEDDIEETDVNVNESGQVQDKSAVNRVNYQAEKEENYKAIPLDSENDEETEYLINKSFEYEEDEVSAKGELGFNAYLQLIIDIDHGNVKFGIAETNESNGKLNMSYKLEKEMKDKEKTFYSQKYPNYEFIVSGIPIVVTNQVEATCGAKAKGEINISVDFEANTKDTVGFLYDSRTGKVEKIKKYKEDSEGLDWSTAASAKGDVSADIMLHLISKLYGSTGADLGIGVVGKAEGEVKVSTKPELVGVGFAGKLGLSLSPEIEGKLIVEKPVVHKKLKEQTLFDKELKAFWSKEWKSSDEWKKDLAWTETGEERTGIFDSKYTTRYQETYAITCPVFEFSYPSSRWKVTDEEVGQGPIAEKVTISNSRGVEITYWSCNGDLGGYGRLLQIADVSKAADSSFTPSIPNGTDSDFSYLGKFMVAKVHIIEENDGSSEENTAVDGETFYAVIPESEIGKTDFEAQYGHIDAFSWEYPSKYAFIATSPDGKFSKNEEKDVIEILKSFNISTK